MMLKKLVLLSAVPLALLSIVQPAEARRLFWWETLNPDAPPPGYYDPQQDVYFDAYGDGYDPAQERFNRRQYELYRREMARRYGNAAYYDDPNADYGYDAPPPPYADPIYPRKKLAKPKTASAKTGTTKPVAKPKVVKAATNAAPAATGALTTASTTAPATQSTKPGSSITCDKGQGIVSSFGFTNVASKSCAAKTLVYTAERGGNKFEVEVNSASGELTAVKKL